MVLGVGLGGITTPVASAASTFTCKTGVTFYGVQQNGDLFTYSHQEPENGTFVWGAKEDGVGNGWNTGRTLAGPDGVIYHLRGDNNGELRRFKLREGTRIWENWNGAQYRSVGNGWERYSTPEYRNRVTVDEKGRLYAIDDKGRLRVYIWQGDDATGMWTPETGGGQVLDQDWNKYDLIVAAGDGVLYARTPGGELFRFRHDFTANRWVQYGLPAGTGWNMFNKVAASGDVLYGTANINGGQLLWYRYREDTNTWDAGDPDTNRGKIVGTGWYNDLDVTIDPNGCRLTGFPVPSRPVVPEGLNDPNVMLRTPDNHLSIFYVNAQKALTVAGQRHLGNGTTWEYQAFSDYHRYAGQPAAALHKDGRVETLANSSEDAVYRGKTQTAVNDTYGAGLNNHGGFMPGAPVMVRDGVDRLRVFAVDASGVLWQRRQVDDNGQFTAWKQISTGWTRDFAVIPSPGTEILSFVTRQADGRIKLHSLSYLASTGDMMMSSEPRLPVLITGALGRPSVVRHLNGALEIFYAKADGRIYSSRKKDDAYPEGSVVGTGEFVAAGNPFAIVRPNDQVEVAVRGSDNFIRVVSQQAPAAAYGEWVTPSLEEAATDPTAALDDANNAFFSWRKPNGLLGVAFVRRDSASLTAVTTPRYSSPAVEGP
ncbi:tachylectin-related carbohydrate-binding protein [Lentzea sp. NPDC055074]